MSVYPPYKNDEPLEIRLARTIQFELDHGGDSLSAARSIIRGARFGYLVFPTQPEN